MFKKNREAEDKAIKESFKRFRETFVGSGDFTCWGVDGYFHVDKINACSGNKVTVSVSYNFNEVSFLERGTFNNEVKKLLKRELSDYEVTEYTFNDRGF